VVRSDLVRMGSLKVDRLRAVLVSRNRLSEHCAGRLVAEPPELQRCHRLAPGLALDSPNHVTQHRTWLVVLDWVEDMSALVMRAWMDGGGER